MRFAGLTDKEAEASRSKYGSNQIPDSEPTTFWQEFKETFGELMIVMWIFGYADIYEPL